MAVNKDLAGQGHMEQGSQRAKIPVAANGSGTGNLVITMPYLMRELYFANDSTSNSLTIEVIGTGLDMTFTLINGDELDERFPEFGTVIVTATDGWRWIARSGQVN